MLVVLFSPRLPAHAGTCLKIGVASGAVSSPAVARIADRLFSLAGACAEILSMPNNRLAAMTDSGELDGEAFKVSTYVDQHPVLTAVPTPVYSFAGNLYWPGGTGEPHGQEIIVGVMLGQLWPKEAAARNDLSTFDVRSYDQMIEMTHSGRLQGFIMAAEAFSVFRPRYDFLEGYKTKQVAEVPLHLVVAKGHLDLVPALDQAVKTLKAHGDIERELKAQDQ
jgi:hypothetical protein